MFQIQSNQFEIMIQYWKPYFGFSSDGYFSITINNYNYKIEHSHHRQSLQNYIILNIFFEDFQIFEQIY